jgi:hypothetical protein
MASFTNRIVEPSVGGSRCVPLPGMVLPKALGSGQLFQLAARSFRSTSLGGAKVALRASGIPCSSRSRAFVISARPTLAGGFGPRLSLSCLTEHIPC